MYEYELFMFFMLTSFVEQRKLLNNDGYICSDAEIRVCEKRKNVLDIFLELERIYMLRKK